MQEVMIMLQPAFLKFSAREELKGEYLRAFFGAFVALIPSYLLSRISDLAIKVGYFWWALAIVLTLVTSIFVTEIFDVGFMRSLLRMKSPKEADYDEKRYDASLVMSGYSENFGNTLKVTFLRQLYLFGWTMLAYLPLLVVIGLIAFMSNTPEISGLINAAMQYYMSPTEEMALYLGGYVMENCQYVVYMLLGAYILMFVLAIFLIRKQYEYIMIPIILADNPDISSKDAFALTREIMHGYRMKYFCVELSFMGWMLLVAILSGFTMSLLIVYALMATIEPYRHRTFIEFYKERRLMMKPDEEGENNNEN